MTIFQRRLVTRQMLNGVPKLNETAHIPEDEKVIQFKLHGKTLSIYVAEASEQPNGDITLYAYMINKGGMGYFWDYFSVRHLESLAFDPLVRIKLNRDSKFQKKKFKELNLRRPSAFKYLYK